VDLASFFSSNHNIVCFDLVEAMGKESDEGQRSRRKGQPCDRHKAITGKRQRAYRTIPMITTSYRLGGGQASTQVGFLLTEKGGRLVEGSPHWEKGRREDGLFQSHSFPLNHSPKV